MNTPVVLGLGSNIGDCRQQLDRAIARLREFLTDLRVSSYRETEALLLPNAPESWRIPYLNAAVLGFTSLSPNELLGRVKSIESELGRLSRDRWAPREIDIDILIWGDTVLDEPGLHIPHRRLLARDFALLPLSELAPQWKYPRPGLNQDCPAKDLARAYPIPRTELVGILNVTPDSFSDGGTWLDAKLAVAHARAMVYAGAAVIDIGAESTRPGATALSEKEEWQRLEPVLCELRRDCKAILSVDTRNPGIAARAAEMGVQWINDVTGFSDPAMVDAIANVAVDLVVMHSLSVPPRPDQTLQEDADPMALVVEWAKAKLFSFRERGITEDRVILDPGIGFGKNPRQNLALLRDIRKLTALGARVLVGHSRKSFLSVLTKRKASDRDVETLAISLELARQNVDYLRIHDVETHARALRATRALQ